MKRYAKFISAAVGAIVAGLAAFGVIPTGEGNEQLVATIAATIGAIGTFFVPNEG